MAFASCTPDWLFRTFWTKSDCPLPTHSIWDQEDVDEAPTRVRVVLARFPDHRRDRTWPRRGIGSCRNRRRSRALFSELDACVVAEDGDLQSAGRGTWRSGRFPPPHRVAGRVARRER